MPSLRLTYIKIIFKAEKQYDFNMQSNQDKTLGAHDVYKIHIPERLKILVQIPTYSNLLTEKLIHLLIYAHHYKKQRIFLLRF